MIFSKFGAEIWRDFQTTGVPSSGPWSVVKPDMRQWMLAVEALTVGFAVDYTFDTATADADPGLGKLRLNNASPVGATLAFIDNSNAGASDASAWLDSFDDFGTTARRGFLSIFDPAAPSTTFRIYQVTGSVVDGTGYRKVTIAHIAGAGTLTNGLAIRLEFVPFLAADALSAATVDLLRIADPAAAGAGIDRLYSGLDGRVRVIEPGGTIALYDRTEHIYHSLYGGI